MELFAESEEGLVPSNCTLFARPHLCSLILARRDKVSAIGRQLQISHLTQVGLFIDLDLFPSFGIEKGDLSALMSSNDLSSEGGESSNRCFTPNG